MDLIKAKQIVIKNKSTWWFGADYNMNIYRGCSHGCIYCDSRSTCYHVDDFDKVRGKENALEIVRNELARKVRSGIIATGAMSDPYNPLEKEYELTRNSLQLISAYDFGVAIATKSPLILRDVSILKEIKEQNPVIVKFTITTPNDEISRKIEPRVAPSSERLKALSKLSSSGVFAGVLMMPILPEISDSPKDVKRLVDMISDAGGRFVYAYFGLTMRDGQREFFYNELEKISPGLSEKYKKRYGNKYNCDIKNSKKQFYEFQNQCTKKGLLYDMKDIVSAYKLGYKPAQLSFFEN